MGVDQVLQSEADDAELSRRAELAALLGVCPHWTVGQLSSGMHNLLTLARTSFRLGLAAVRSCMMDGTTGQAVRVQLCMKLAPLRDVSAPLKT
jgi:hypothetical protein